MWRPSLNLAVVVVVAVGGPARADDHTAGYFDDLARLGVIDTTTGNPDTLDAELALAESALERADFAAAAATLHGIVHSPRFADFADTVAYQNAEYDLLVALAAGGAGESALVMAERILRRGPEAPYFAVAHRRAVDVALATRAYGPVLARLAAVPVAGELPAEAAGERAYLRGRSAYDAGDLDGAEKELATVSRKSRLYSSSVYLRGVLRVRQGKLTEATDAFCEIAQTPDDDRYTFFVDDRYFALKDLARLGAARVAHEEGRHDDAYYHYFQIPDDSDRLPEALFEAAWTMYQKRELRTARELVKELLAEFPTSPQTPEAQLLAGYIELADCKFEEAREHFETLGADVRQLVEAIVKARASRDARLALLRRALGRRAVARGPSAMAPPLGKSPEDRVLAMLRLDPALLRLSDALAGLEREAALAPGVIAEWRELAARVPGSPVAPSVGDRAPLLARIRALRDEVSRERALLLAAASEGRSDEAPDRLPQLDRARAQLDALEERVRATLPPAPGADPGLTSRLQKDLAATSSLASRATALARAFDDAADRTGGRELLRLHHQLVRIFEKSRLGRIDAVIGEKRMYEKEIEAISSDQYQPRNAGKVFQHGLIGDTEEYWPPEEEVWEDEYEGWK